MFKTVADEVWAFDAEWVPDPVAGRVLYGLSDALTDREVVEEMWQRNGATADDPMPYLKTILCRVVSIAAIIRRVTPDGEVKLLLHALPEHVDNAADCDEAVMLSRFLTGVGQRKPQLVGFNSHAADLKIFIQRSIVQGISLPAFCARPDKPWEGKDYFARGSEWHIDLKDIVSSWGKAMPSLHELATLSGIPGKMMDVDGQLMDGKHVAEMWLDGDVKGIVQYNVRDALTTYLVWLRIAHFGGFFMDEAYREEQERVRVLIAEKAQSPRYEHLLTYREEWDRLTSIRLWRGKPDLPDHVRGHGQAPQAYQVILFDLGGVLVDVEGVAAFQRMLGRPLSQEEVWQRWLTASSWVSTFESGRCTPEAFAAGIVAEWGLTVTAEAFLDDFRSWPKRLFPGVREMLALLAPHCTLACLSNTNSVHWPHVRDTLGLSDLLHRYYLSHEIGHLKPTRAAFEHVLADLGCAPHCVVFLDDNQLNVDAAQAVGIQAYRTVGIAEVQTALQSLGLLGPA